MKKRTMEKEHQAEERRKKVLMEIAGAVVVLTVIVSIGLSHLGTDKVNTSAGVKAIKKLEKADVSEVETKISNIEKEEKQAIEDWQNRPLSEKFAHAVILGDSITTGFTVYDVLDTSKVVAEKGMHLDHFLMILIPSKGRRPIKCGVRGIKMTCLFLATSLSRAWASKDSSSSDKSFASKA